MRSVGCSPSASCSGWHPSGPSPRRGRAPIGPLASWRVSTVLAPGGFASGVLDLRLRDASTTVGPGGSFAHADLAPTGLIPGESGAVLVPVRTAGPAPF